MSNRESQRIAHIIIDPSSSLLTQLNYGMTPRSLLLLTFFPRLSSAFTSPVSSSFTGGILSSISRRALSSTTTLAMSKQNSNSNALNIHWFRQNDIR